MNGFDLIKKLDMDGVAHLLCYWTPQCSLCTARRLCNVDRLGKNGFIYLLQQKIPDETVQTFIEASAAAINEETES